jgi:hypothetical protein
VRELLQHGLLKQPLVRVIAVNGCIFVPGGLNASKSSKLEANAASAWGQQLADVHRLLLLLFSWHILI